MCKKYIDFNVRIETVCCGIRPRPIYWGRLIWRPPTDLTPIGTSFTSLRDSRARLLLFFGSRSSPILASSLEKYSGGAHSRVQSNHLLIYFLPSCCGLLKVTKRQAAVQWVSSRQMVRHRLLPVTASNAVFPTTSSLSLSLINYGPQLQQTASHWAVPVTSFAREDDVRLVALGNRDAMPKRDDGERSLVSVSDTQISSHRCAILFHNSG